MGQTIRFTFVILIMISFLNKSTAQYRIGVFADCQYAEQETAINRYYKNSKQKLKDCIEHFNRQNLHFVVNLGDLIDKNFSSFDTILPVLSKSKHQIFHVTGNHDLEVEQELIKEVPKKLGLKKNYYSFSENGWRFIFLNGNEISMLSNNEEIKTEAKIMLENLTKKGHPNNQPWDGALGEKQISWLQGQLIKSEKQKEKAVIFCHYPVYPIEKHCLWDYDKVLHTLEKYSCVKLWINGHNHAGNYGKLNACYFVNLRGMVETETQNAFSTITFFEDKIKIEGFGREESRVLEF